MAQTRKEYVGGRRLWWRGEGDGEREKSRERSDRASWEMDGGVGRRGGWGEERVVRME